MTNSSIAKVSRRLSTPPACCLAMVAVCFFAWRWVLAGCLVCPPRKALAAYHHERIEDAAGHGMRLARSVDSNGTPAILCEPVGRPGDRGARLRKQLERRGERLGRYGEVSIDRESDRLFGAFAPLARLGVGGMVWVRGGFGIGEVWPAGLASRVRAPVMVVHGEADRGIRCAFCLCHLPASPRPWGSSDRAKGRGLDRCAL